MLIEKLKVNTCLFIIILKFYIVIQLFVYIISYFLYTKGMGGVENLAKALQETPKFGGEESQQDVQEKLQHMRSMLTFLEASR